MYYVVQDLGNTLRNTRQEKGMSQGELSRASGIATSNISLIESEKTLTPRKATLDALAKALRVDPETFYSEDDVMADRLDLLERRVDALDDLIDRVAEIEAMLTPSEARATLMQLAAVHGKDELMELLRAIDSEESTGASPSKATTPTPA